jgi:hypothetical protein
MNTERFSNLLALESFGTQKETRQGSGSERHIVAANLSLEKASILDPRNDRPCLLTRHHRSAL